MNAIHSHLRTRFAGTPAQKRVGTMTKEYTFKRLKYIYELCFHNNNGLTIKPGCRYRLQYFKAGRTIQQ